MIPGYPNNRVRLSINCVAVNDNTLLNQGNLPLPSIFPHGATIMICFIHVTFLHTLFFSFHRGFAFVTMDLSTRGLLYYK